MAEKAKVVVPPPKAESVVEVPPVVKDGSNEVGGVPPSCIGTSQEKGE